MPHVKPNQNNDLLQPNPEKPAQTDCGSLHPTILLRMAEGHEPLQTHSLHSLTLLQNYREIRCQLTNNSSAKFSHLSQLQSDC